MLNIFKLKKKIKTEGWKKIKFALSGRTLDRIQLGERKVSSGACHSRHKNGIFAEKS